MVAQAIRTGANARGARPFEPARDLTGVARLLEEAFRAEHTFPLSNTPVLRELGIILWTLSYTPVFPENVTGFVWLENGQIVGNVTISHDEGRLDRFMISNVAVKPDYRRQGIARALMQMTIDHLREHGARWVLLNVRPTNLTAVNLYRDLGFNQVETRGEWSLSIPPVRVSDAGAGYVGRTPGEGLEVRAAPFRRSPCRQPVAARRCAGECPPVPLGPVGRVRPELGGSLYRARLRFVHRPGDCAPGARTGPAGRGGVDGAWPADPVTTPVRDPGSPRPARPGRGRSRGSGRSRTWRDFPNGKSGCPAPAHIPS